MSGLPHPARADTGSYADRVRQFRLRIVLLALPALLIVAYYRWIAPLFGAAHRRRMQVALPRAVCGWILRANGIHLRTTGQQHLAGAGRPRLLMVNHNSRFDGYILLALTTLPLKAFWSNTAHVTAEGFSVIQLFGRTFDLFFVHDKSDKRRTLREFRLAEAYVAGGATLATFPEGTFSSDGVIRDFGTSCVGLALRANAEIVPVVMAGTRATFEQPEAGAQRKEVRVSVMAPLSTAGRSRHDIAAMTRELESMMNAELQRLLAPESLP